MPINSPLIGTREVYTKQREAIHMTFIGITRSVCERCKKSPPKRAVVDKGIYAFLTRHFVTTLPMTRKPLSSDGSSVQAS